MSTPVLETTTPEASKPKIVDSEKVKAMLLKRAHESLRTLTQEQRNKTIQSFHASIVERAKRDRMSLMLGKYMQDSIEEQIAKTMSAIKYKGFWVQHYFREIPVLVTEAIDSMEKDLKWAKDRP